MFRNVKLKNKNPETLAAQRFQDLIFTEFYSHSFTIFSHALFSICFPIILGVFQAIFLYIILFIIARVAKSVAIKQK